MKIKLTALVAFCAVALVGCGTAQKTEVKKVAPSSYRYHNVVTEKGAEEFRKDLQELGVPKESWQALSSFMDTYHEANKSYEPVAKDWTSMELTKDANTFTTTMEDAEYNEKLSHFPKDLNCRQTAFLLLRSLVSYDAAKAKKLPEHAEFPALKQYIPSLTEADSQLYSLLFYDNPDHKSVADFVKSWKDAGLVFSDKLRLLSAEQDLEGSVVSMHVGVVYEKDGKIYFFEKMDPALPYRLSEFASWKDFKDHMLNGRFQLFKDSIKLLVNDTDITELIKSN